MLHQGQFISSISPNQRQMQQSSSPSDGSMSTATPPHQISRASPASTALVVSTNNINIQPASRQLTPLNNTNSSSSNTTGSSSLNSNDVAQQQQQLNPNMNNNNGGGPTPPNPTIRQFACHSKSMSAGVVVPVPGISNHLTTAGMNQNNSMAPPANNHHHHNHHHHQQQPQQQQQQLHMRQISGPRHYQVNNNNLSTHLQQQQTTTDSNNNPIKQQVVRENNHHHHHHRSVSSQQQQHHHSQQQQQHHQQQQQQHHQQQQQFMNQQQQQDGSSQNFLTGRQATSSSIILSNNNINNLHNRSASTHLSSVLLAPHHHQQQQQRNQHHHNQQQQQQNNNHLPSHVTDSIWSFNENMSKSHGKLTASGYLHPHPYLFNPSLNDMSCDNLSNVSRLLDGPPPAAPGYYLQDPSGQNNNNQQQQQQLNSNGRLSIATTSCKTPEFLPICDLLFNLISMIVYFCENVFNIIALIALYYHATNSYWALIGAAFVLASNFICQYLSLKWLFKMKLDECRRKRDAQEELEDEENCVRDYNRMPTNMRQYQCGSCTWLPDGATEVQLKFLLSIVLDAIMHLFCLGFLIRYIKLVIPVTDTLRVKREARDLCMLRMIHGFVQSAPLLLVQSYMICSQTSYSTSIINLSVTSALLSLLNVCWALASFTKYAREKLMHKFVLTWLGIVSQLLWRLGTISSRVAALTIYAVYYNYWMLVVLSLHWLSMFLLLIKPGGLLRDENNLSRSKRFSLAVGVAWIYCFCYINFEEQNSRGKMGTFYLVMFLENNLLFSVCQMFPTQVAWLKTLSIMVVYLGFVFGMFFMFIYYKHFHVTVLNNGLSCSQDSIDSIADQLSPAGRKVAGFNPGTLRLRSEDSLTTSGRTRYNSNISATLHHTGSHPEITRNNKPPYLTTSHHNNHHNNHHQQQQHTNSTTLAQSGVFNCKLNTNGMKKLQKIQSSQLHGHNT